MSSGRDVTPHPSASRTQEAPSAASEARDLSNLDILRALAVVLVFGGHLLATLEIRGLGELAHLGVLLFFVHTSLVLMLSMDRAKLRGAALYRSFSIRRVFRLYPLSTLCVFLFVFFEIPSVPWTSSPADLDAGMITSNLLLVQNLTGDGSVNCVLWSLPFEVQMYAVLPLIYMFAISRGRRPRTAATLWGMTILLAAMEVAVRGTGSLILRYGPCFMAGVIAWTQLASVKPRFRSVSWVASLALLVVVFRLSGIVRVYGPDPTLWTSQSLRTDGGIWWPHELDLVRDWVSCLAIGLLIPLFSDCRARWLVRPCKAIAKYSYGIYLWHVPVLWGLLSVLGAPGESRVLFVALTLLGTAMSAYLGYHLIEDPAIRLGRRLARPSNP